MPEELAEAGFELEAEDLAQKLDAELLEIERAEHAEPRAVRITAALKTAHTLKGLAAVVGQPTVARTCHLLEDLLKAIQRDGTAPSAHIVNLMLAAGSILCAATQAVRQGKLPDELLKPIQQRLESAVRIAGQPEESSVTSGVQSSMAMPGLTPAVRVTDDKLDAILAISEEIHNAAAVIRMREDQLDTLCDEFGLLLVKSRGLGNPGALQPWSGLVGRLEDLKAAMQRSSRTLQKVSTGLQQQLGGLRLVSVGSAFRAFAHAARDIAVALGKEVAFSIEDFGTALDRSIVENLSEPLLHLIRNAVDHGLESPQERRARGKPPQGQLRIVARPIGSWAEIAVEDDGRGIDLDRVRRRAAELHLSIPGDEAETVALLFQGGLSTKTDVTELSGRGLGLAIVHDRVEQLHGHVSAVTSAGHGSRFVIAVPMALTRMRLLFLAQNGSVFAVPCTSIARLVRPTGQQVSAGILDDGGGHEAATLYRLAQVLGMRQEHPDGAACYEAFVLHDGVRQAAFLVDALLREDEAVVKSLGPRLKSAPAYLGGTLLPDGRVALVLNPDYLITAAGGGAHPPSQAPSQPAPGTPARVLFVEDSDILRAMGRRILEQAGFQVQLAADGRQAFDLWKKFGADVIVTDFEMPEMDGLALTRAIREAAHEVKIIVLSASGGSESRTTAIEAGADAYLVKDRWLKQRLPEIVRKICPTTSASNLLNHASDCDATEKQGEC